MLDLSAEVIRISSSSGRSTFRPWKIFSLSAVGQIIFSCISGTDSSTLFSAVKIYLPEVANVGTWTFYFFSKIEFYTWNVSNIFYMKKIKF